MNAYDQGFEKILQAVGIDKLAALQSLEKEAAMPNWLASLVGRGRTVGATQPGALRRAWDFMTKGRTVRAPSAAPAATAAQAAQTGSRVTREGAQRAFETRARAAVPETVATDAAVGMSPWKKRALIGAGALGLGAAGYGAHKAGLIDKLRGGSSMPVEGPQNAYYQAYY